MPKKPKKLAPEKTVQKKPDVNRIVPVVHGVQGRLGWKLPYEDTTNDFHMPEGGYDEKTRENFYKLLKDRFGLNLAADPADASRRIFVMNRGGKALMQTYRKNMEELDLMPDCKEKFDRKAHEAHELEKGLFFSMAKGSLAIVPLGENEPRQVLCDYDKNVLVVTEPFKNAAPIEMRKLYNNFEKKPVPDVSRRPAEPVFDQQEPQPPTPPEPFNMKEPGPRPEPANFKRAPEPPAQPEDLLGGKSHEQRVRETYERLYAEAGLKEPPAQAPSRPEPFTMMEPVPPREVAPDEKMPEQRQKPANYDAVMARYNAMGEEAEKLDPGRYDHENHVRINLIKPAPFEQAEPTLPKLDPPEYPELAMTLEVPGKPLPDYSFYKPEEPKYRQSEIPHPVLGMEKPEIPQLGALPEDLTEPAPLRAEPDKPGFFTHLLSRFSKRFRDRIADHDAWEQERQDHDVAVEKYEAKKASWIIKLKEDHGRDLEEYDRKTELYNAEKARYDREMEKYNADVAIEAKDLEIENEQIRTEYEYNLGKYNESREALGDRFEAEKQKYEDAVKAWEEKNPEILRKNKEIRENNQRLLDEYDKACEPFKQLYGEAWDDKAKMKEVRDRITAKYEADLEDYNSSKAIHDAAQERYDRELERVAKECAEKGIDPEENRRYNEDYTERAARAEQLEIERSDYLLSFPEVANFDSDQDVYEEDMEYIGGHSSPYEKYLEEKARYEQDLETYNKAKAEYDEKLDLYNNYGKIVKDYNARNDQLKANAETTEQRREQDDRNLRADYAKQKEQYDQDLKIWQRDRERYDEGVRSMSREGGLIYNWERDVENYEAAKKAHAQAVQKYNEDAKSYPERLDRYIADYKEHLKDLEEYKGKMQNYVQEKKAQDSVIAENEKARDKHYDQIHQNPLYLDYKFRFPEYDYAHEQWKNKLVDSNQYKQLQNMDPEQYKAAEKQIFKDYESARKHAPKDPSAKDQKEYNVRIQEYNYLQKFPTGMHSYLKSLNARERDYNESLNKHFKKDSDIGLADYKKAAVEKMYCSVVRQKAERFANSAYFRDNNTKAIDSLLEPGRAEKAKAEMLKNKKLMKSIETSYKEGKAQGSISRTLQNPERLCKMYDNAYEPENTKTAIKDPVLGEYRGSHDAIEKAQAKNPVAGK